MALTQASYAAAERLKETHPDAARSLRKAAVAVPARIAEALEALADADDARRDEHVLLARGALAEVARQARRSASANGEVAALAGQADELERSVLFDLGAGASVS
jgi:hypothetical protein